MRVAIFPSQFYPHVGGVEELVRQQAMELVRCGHHPLILTNRWPKTLTPSERVDGLDIRRIIFRVPGVSFRQTAGALLLGPMALHQTRREVRQHQAEVLHVQCVSSNAHYALRVKRLTGLPLVVTLQGELTMDAGRIFERSEFVRMGVRKILKAADVITGCSAKTLADGEAMCGYAFGSRGRVIFNGARVDDFRDSQPFPHPRPYIFGIGRLVPQKGFDLLIRAFAALPGTGHDLLIAGEGPERNALEGLSKSLGMGSRIHFVGRADRRQVVKLFAGCSLFVLPSRADEGLPVVCAEALAAGRATVATRVGGVAEVVLDEQTGLIVSRENSAALADAIGRLLADDAMRNRLAANARLRSALFSWQQITRQYVDVYRDAIEIAARTQRVGSSPTRVAS